MKPKKLRCVQRSVDRHWVGDGFPVRTLFAYSNLGPVIDPFLLLDYAGPARVLADERAARSRRAPAPRLRDGDDRLRRRGRAPRLVGRRREDRPGRRAVDDRGLGSGPRGVPRPRVRAPRRTVRDGAAVGEPAGEGQEGAARLPGDPRSRDPEGESSRRARSRARDRGRVRGRQGSRADVHADRRSGTCASRAREPTELALPDGYTTALVVLRGSLRANGSEPIREAEVALFDRAGEACASRTPRTPPRSCSAVSRSASPSSVRGRS